MKQKNLILMVVAVGCGLVAAFLTTQINAKPKVEMVEVWVATKDLPVGTMLTKVDLPKLAVKKAMTRDSLPPAFVVNEDELTDKRLTRSVAKDETFTPVALTKGGVITLPEGMDMVSLPMTVVNSAAGFVGPGSKVDVLATLKLSNKIEAFPLLIDMLILTVDTNVSYDTGGKNGVFPNMSMVSLAVTQEQALLLSLAKQRNCHMELLLRHPGKIKDTTYDIKKIKKLLEDEKNPALLVKTDSTTGEPIDGPPVSVEPKVEKVKVLIAKADIPSNTDITKELVATKFEELEYPKDLVAGAIMDLSPYLNREKTFRGIVAKGQWVTESMIGDRQQKSSPIEEFIPFKTDATAKDPVTPPVEVNPTTVPAERPIRDVAVHGANGTEIYRYEEVKPGEWKLKMKLTPEQAAKLQSVNAEGKKPQ